MTALLPFAWKRLDEQTRLDLAAFEAQFACIPFLRPKTHHVPAPVCPSYLIFTSANGIRAALDQPWFESWHGIPTYVVGPKTEALARRSGLNVQLSVQPPSPDIVPHLPGGSGLWISGTDTAHDLLALSAPSALSRLPLYSIEVDEPQRQELQARLRTGNISSALISSERTLQELAILVREAAANLTHLVVLSQRLALSARHYFPTAEVKISDTLETGVHWLVKK